MRTLPSRALAVAVSIAGLSVVSRASASPGEWHAGGRVGFATVTGVSPGPALELHGAYELSDFFDVVVQGIGSRHDGASGTDALSLSGGMAYKIDVFEWIPYIGLQAGYYRYMGPLGMTHQNVGASAHVGLDYLFSRSFAVGVDVAPHGILVPETGPLALTLTVLAGAEYRFGW